MQVILATRNIHKVREICKIFEDLPIHFISLSEFPDSPLIEEDGHTFKENAIKKALNIAQVLGEICLADDSGIEVDHLHGAPGIYSARFAGENATDEENNRKLLQLLESVPFEKRRARYRCVMAVSTPKGKIQSTQGTCEGLIALESIGKNGFGYDPLFFYPPFQKTFGLTDPIEKNKVSHRYQALCDMKPFLEKLILSR